MKPFVQDQNDYFIKHKILKEIFINIIQTLNIGDKLNTINEIKQKYNVSIGTIYKAFDDLEREGFIERHAGRGIFIKNKNPVAGKDTIRTNIKNNKVLIVHPKWVSKSLTYYLIEMQFVLTVNGYEYVLYFCDRDTVLDDILECSKGIKGLYAIIFHSPGQFDLTDQKIARLNTSGSKIIFIDTNYYIKPFKNIYLCGPDSFQQGYQLINYLIKMGHSNMAVITSQPNYACINTRINGMNSAIYKNKLTNIIFTFKRIKSYDKCQVCSYNNTVGIISIIKELQITALIYESVEDAIAGIRALKDNGLSVPEDVSLISIGHFTDTEYMVPRLTLVDIIDHDVIVNEVIHILNTPIIPDREIKIQSAVFQGESVKDIRFMHPA
ncbi:MAG TPA: hypothetical protein DC049_14475 [Spirochaetia bacterium]|nr:hypothetical protein [Spirochaetia bacterium]